MSLIERIIKKFSPKKITIKQVALVNFQWTQRSGNSSIFYEFQELSDGTRVLYKFIEKSLRGSCTYSWVDALEIPWKNSTFQINEKNMSAFLNIDSNDYLYLYEGDVKNCCTETKNA